VDDQSPNVPVRKPVTLRVARAQKIIGVPVSADEIATIFTRLGLAHTRAADSFTVTPPSYRFDIEIEEDLIEEVARIYGFERIPGVPPLAMAAMHAKPETHRTQHALRAAMAACDYQEIITYSFVEEAWERDFTTNANPIKLLNPIASQMSVMRSSLIGGLIDTLRFNLNHKAARVRIFEIGKVFTRDATVMDGALAVQGVHQPNHIAGLAYGGAQPEQWGGAKRSVDFFDVKADIEALIAPLEARFEPAGDHPAFHPGRCARVSIAGVLAGYVGELHPKWLHAYDLAQAPIVFELAVKPLQTVPLAAPQIPSKTPTVRRDIALVVDQAVSCDAMLATLNAARAPVVREVSLFDVYQGAGLPVGKKSLAFQVLMQDTSATLTDEITDNTVNKLIQAAQTAHGASLRA
jgi:phenylalanyl-tRNA synthetase beta chain